MQTPQYVLTGPSCEFCRNKVLNWTIKKVRVLAIMFNRKKVRDWANLVRNWVIAIYPDPGLPPCSQTNNQAHQPQYPSKKKHTLDSFNILFLPCNESMCLLIHISFDNFQSQYLHASFLLHESSSCEHKDVISELFENRSVCNKFHFRLAGIRTNWTETLHAPS